jgi:hypothetical protein
VFDREIVATFFGFQEGVKPQPRRCLWSEFVEELKTGHKIIKPDQKEFTWHFNLTEFKEGGQRRDSDAILSHGLVIDYDANVTIDEAVERFGTKAESEFVLFTSFNHQRKKYADDFERDKFRVVLPLKEPMPAGQYKDYKRYLTETFAPGCDPRLAVVSQLYAHLVCPKETESLARVIHHPGEPVDWHAWPTDTSIRLSEVKTAAVGTAIDRTKKYLEPTDTIRLANGKWIAVQDIDRHVSDVYCPFHGDKSPGAFVNKSARGTIYLHCHKCGSAYMQTKTSAPPTFKPIARSTKPPVVAGSDAEPKVEEPYDRARREKLLIKSCIREWSTGTLLLYAFEGFGKSRLCPLLAQVDRLDLDRKTVLQHQLKGQGRSCVVFATKTNKQAVEQAEGFRLQTIADNWDPEAVRPLRVQLITGRVHNLKELRGIDALTDDGSHPWDAGDINRKKTLAIIQEELECTAQRAEEVWDEAEAEEPDFDNYDIIVTTHERVRAWGRIQDQSSWKNYGRVVVDHQIFPDGTIVFFDDPGRNDFALLAPYDERYVKTKVEGKPLAQVKLDDYQYFMRPDLFHLDSGLYNVKLVFTTTEMITRDMIERAYPGITVPELMPPNKMKAGDIAIIGTRNVQAARDGLMLPLIHALERDGHKVTLIADGMGAEWNHQTNKGVNSIDSDLLIEISYPTPQESIQLANELDGSIKEMRAVQVAIALDKMHQAIGRVGGYRSSDKADTERKRCVVLCDPKMHEMLFQQTRYFVEHHENADEWRKGGLKKPTDLYGLVSWYMRNVLRWVTERDGRYFLSDLRRAIGGGYDRRRIDRMLRALKTVLGDITDRDGSFRNPNAAEILQEGITLLESAHGGVKAEEDAAA